MLAREAILAEVWAPRARAPDNKDSGQTWLAKNLGRLQDEIGRAAGGLDADVVVKRRGCLRLNKSVVGSDVEGFMAAVEGARAAQGAQRVSAAEQAVATLSRALVACGSQPACCRTKNRVVRVARRARLGARCKPS